MAVGGCTQVAAKRQLVFQYEPAIAKCIDMASVAMPNGMQDPEETTILLDSEHLCVKLAAGHNQ
jgi:hypothetical protein